VLRTTALLLALLLAACGGLLAACGGGSTSSVSQPPPDGPPIGQVPGAFLLPDVNPSSATHMTMVGPAGSANRTSAWYFGWAT
jgi:hypothetical protein